MNVPWSEAQAALDKLGCTEFMDREMGQLSGGQRKRVALAAALIEEPDLLAGERGKGGGEVREERAEKGCVKWAPYADGCVSPCQADYRRAQRGLARADKSC